MKYKNIFLAILISGVFFAFLPTQVEAKSFTYDRYDVDVEINADSTVDVTEKLEYRFDGTFRGVIRQLTLEDRERNYYCETSGQTCGGFDRVALIDIYDENGDAVPRDSYEIYTEDDEDTGIRYFTIKWEIWPGGRYFAGDETYTWEIKYRLYGSIGWLEGAAGRPEPYFYWNALPSDRGGSVGDSVVKITLPEGSVPNGEAVSVYADYDLEYYYSTEGRSVLIETENLGSYGNLTISYPLDRNTIDMPGQLSYGGWLPWFGTEVSIDGVKLGAIGGGLNSFPTGDHKVEFSFPGYESRTYEVDVSANELIEIDSTLTPSAFMTFLLLADLVLNVLGIILIPVGIFWTYLRWRNHGQDENKQSTIVPLFKPPVGIHPYLLGSLEDEKVDKRDVTGTIIDLAYRGYIKIKEIDRKKNYELTRLDGKPGAEGLNSFETRLMKDIFGSSDTQETKDLGKRFASKYPKLVSKIYKEMVQLGYFTESPQTTRGKYFGCGFITFVVGILSTIILGYAAVPLMGVIGPVLLGLALLAVGVGLFAIANFMPAKTRLGSEIHAQILGFRMYLNTAERFRLQGLGPEEFERYLSYAVVFEIEKEWADKFKGIYEGQPDWYEGQSDVWDAYWVSRFTRDFANSVNSSAYVAPSSGSASGSGWSGGGSFGGFSGGGGGGGGSGAF